MLRLRFFFSKYGHLGFQNGKNFSKYPREREKFFFDPLPFSFSHSHFLILIIILVGLHQAYMQQRGQLVWPAYCYGNQGLAFAIA